MAAVARHINSETVAVRLDGHSDYGMVLETFWDQWGPQVRKRTSVIVLGDARNNYHASRSWVLKSIRERARHLYWLNPEPAYRGIPATPLSPNTASTATRWWNAVTSASSRNSSKDWTVHSRRETRERRTGSARARFRVRFERNWQETGWADLLRTRAAR